MITTDELAQIRADVAGLLPDTGNILSLTIAGDGQGGQVETWGTATAGVAYRLDPVRGRELPAGAAIQPYHTFILTLPHDAVIAASNRFETQTGAVFSVTSVDGEKSWRVSTRATVERI
jgi:hypothetical protein